MTVQSIYGALSTYLLIGLMYAAWFGAIAALVARLVSAYGTSRRPRPPGE